MFKVDTQFRESPLKKVQDPEVWITELEDFSVRFNDMSSSISENQFMTHVLNSCTLEDAFQCTLMEKRIGGEEKSLTVEVIIARLEIHFERWCMKSTWTCDGEEEDKKEVFSGQFKYNQPINNNNSNCDQEKYVSQDVVFATTAKNLKSFQRISEFVLQEPVGISTILTEKNIRNTMIGPGLTQHVGHI
jgi:hypothetical protein